MKINYEFRNLQWELFYKELGVLHCKQWKKIAIQYIITYLLVNICKKHSCSNIVLFYSNKSHQNTLSEILNLFSFFLFSMLPMKFTWYSTLSHDAINVWIYVMQYNLWHFFICFWSMFWLLNKNRYIITRICYFAKLPV